MIQFALGPLKVTVNGKALRHHAKTGFHRPRIRFIRESFFRHNNRIAQAELLSRDSRGYTLTYWCRVVVTAPQMLAYMSFFCLGMDPILVAYGS